MKVTILVSAFFLNSFSHVSSQCSLFSVSDCQLRENEIINEIHLPINQGALHACQGLCRSQGDCTHWRWNDSAQNCTLLAYSYLHLCQTISSGSENNFNDCVNQDSNTCDDFVPENCNMLGNIVLNQKLADAHACQEYLQLIGDALNAQVFIFSETDQICYLLDSSEKICDTLSGPRDPVVDGCETTISTTSTSTSTASMSSTSLSSASTSSSTSNTGASPSTSSTTSTTIFCQDDWIDGSGVDLGCLYIEESGMSHAQAQELCESMESQLVEIHTSNQLNFISSELIENHENSYYWTGATDALSEGNWTWPESGFDVDEFYWCPQEDPNNESEKIFSIMISIQNSFYCGIGVTDAYTIPKPICQK